MFTSINFRYGIDDIDGRLGIISVINVLKHNVTEWAQKIINSIKVVVYIKLQWSIIYFQYDD